MMLAVSLPQYDPSHVMFSEKTKNNVLNTEEWSEYDLTKPVMTLANVSSEKVQSYYKMAYRKFYMRPSYVMKFHAVGSLHRI